MAEDDAIQNQLNALLDYQKSLESIESHGIAQETLRYLQSLRDVAIGVIFLNQDGNTVEVVFHTETISIKNPDFFNDLKTRSTTFRLSNSSEYFTELPSFMKETDYFIVPGKWRNQSTAFFVFPTEPQAAKKSLYSLLCNEFARSIHLSQKGTSARDANERLRAEEQFKRLNTQLQVRNDAINQIGILSISNSKGEITEVNEQFTKLTKYTEEEVVGKTYKVIQSGVHSPSFYKNLWDTVKRGEIWRDEICNKDKEGNLIWMLKTIIPFQLDHNSDEQYYCSLSADITDQKERENQLQIAKDEVEKAIKIKEDFLSTMSHELRTPLNAVIGISQLLQKIPADEYQNKLVSTLGISAKNLHNLINDILDYSKIEAGKVTIHNEPFNLRKSIENIKTSFENYTVEKGLDFEVVIDANVPEWISGDELRLGQILNNLITNAIKYTAFGFVKIKVSRSVLTEKTENLIFQIEDSGIGIKETELKNIFNEFEQVGRNQVNKLEGTGLGLSIVKNLIALMEGDIEVESEYMKGTTFRIEIPFTAVDESSLVTLATEVDQEEINLQGKKVLYVEDVYTNQFLIRSILEDYQAECFISSDGYHAIELCEKNKFDLILMDIHLPDMNGYETAYKIRELATYKHIPIIAFSANTSELTQQSVVNSSINDLLAKPLDLKKLDQLLRNYLVNHSMKAEIDLSFFRYAFSNNLVKLQNYLELVVIDIENFQEKTKTYYSNRDLPSLYDEVHKLEPIVTKLKFHRLLAALEQFKKQEPFSAEMEIQFNKMMAISSDFIHAVQTTEL